MMATEKFTPYQRKLLIFLSVATFFEGFDFMALSQILPELRADLGLDISDAGVMITVINAGTVLAFLLVRKADTWGRRRVLTLTIAGYTLFTGLTAISQTAVHFALFQLIARMFLIAEWGVATLYAAEEFPAARRGLVIGLIQGFSSLGSVLCAGVAPVLLQTSLGWRSLYLVGVLPLVLVAIARRSIKETARFSQHDTSDDEQDDGPGFVGLIMGPYRKRLALMGLLWALTYLGMSNAVTFWKDFVVTHRGWTPEEVGLALTIAALGSMPLVFYSGKLLDILGRRWGAVVIYGIGTTGVAGSFLFSHHIALQVALVAGIFGVSGVLPVLNAYSTELFPTELRGDAFGWANNILGRVGYVAAPVMVTFAAEWQIGGSELGLGTAMAASMVFPLIALVIIMVSMPETSGRELEETSQL